MIVLIEIMRLHSHSVLCPEYHKNKGDWVIALRRNLLAILGDWGAGGSGEGWRGCGVDRLVGRFVDLC